MKIVQPSLIRPGKKIIYPGKWRFMTLEESLQLRLRLVTKKIFLSCTEKDEAVKYLDKYISNVIVKK
jgi:hypothetical protein